MKKHLSFLLIALCGVFSTALCSEPEMPLLNKSDANMVGHILDKKTKEHLPYVAISLKGTTIGTVTDATGHYFLKNLPEGTFTIEVSFVGYKTEYRKVTLQKGKTLEEDFEIDEDAIALDAVVVSANRNETTRRTAPNLVHVLDLKTFEMTNSNNLAEGLNYQPGVRVENNCQNCGFQEVRINGLSGPYTQILLDSRPVYSALSGVYGLEQIPAGMIERVEVMRGGGSALFGSSAIAGTINVITKDPIRNTGQLSHSMSLIGTDRTSDHNTSLNASLVTDNRKAGLYIFGQNRQRNGYDHDGDGFTELPKLKNQMVGFRSFLKTSTYSKLTIEYHHMEEFRRGGDSLNHPPHEAEVAEQIEHSIDGGGVKFDLFSSDDKHRLALYSSIQNTNRDSYYGTGKDLNAYGRTQGLTLMGGAQYTRNFTRFWFMPASLVAGVEYNRDQLKDHMPGYDRHLRQVVNIKSAFLQNEWKNDQWGVLVGARLDKHSMIDRVIVSPRANLRFNPSKNVNLRLTYSAGFRGPQTFDEDLHVESVGGTSVMIELDPDLKEEKSHSVSLSADFYRRFGALQSNLLIEGFYTRLSDAFSLDKVGENAEGTIIKRRTNGSGAKVIGATVEGKLAYLSLWQLQGGFTVQKSVRDQARQWSDQAPAEKKMFRSPDTYGYFTATYAPVKPFTIALSGTYTGSMLVEHLAGYISDDTAFTTPDFFDMGVKLSYDFKIQSSTTLQLYAGLQNIFDAYQDDFDQGKDRDSKYIYGPGLPRTYYAGLKLSF